MEQFCWSKGKYLMSIAHVLLNIDGGTQRISPSEYITTKASRLSSRRVSALLNNTISGVNTSLAGIRTEPRPP